MGGRKGRESLEGSDEPWSLEYVWEGSPNAGEEINIWVGHRATSLAREQILRQGLSFE